MTCIVAAFKDGIGIMGCDSQGSNGYSKNEFKHGKIITKSIPSLKGAIPIMFGFTSSFRLGDLIRYSLTPPVYKGDAYEWMVTSFVPCLKSMLDANDYNIKDLGCNFLIIVDDRVFELASDLSVIEANGGYASVGSGTEVAMGAMFALKDKSALDMAKAGLQAAEFHAMGVGGKNYLFKVAKNIVTELNP